MRRPRRDALQARLERIRAVVTDVDGCLTEGHVAYLDGFSELKLFDSKDGLGCALANRAGLVTAIVTGRACHAVARRARELPFTHCFQGHHEKVPAWEELKRRTGLSDEQLAYLGDDLPDLPLLRRAGCSFAPADAALDVRDRADVVLEAPGGRGAFREMVERVLRAQGAWEPLVKEYLDR